jgi:hypothetical protein
VPGNGSLMTTSVLLRASPMADLISFPIQELSLNLGTSPLHTVLRLGRSGMIGPLMGSYH